MSDKWTYYQIQLHAAESRKRTTTEGEINNHHLEAWAILTV